MTLTSKGTRSIGDRGGAASTTMLILSALLLVGGVVAYVLVPAPEELDTPERDVNPGAREELQASQQPPSHIVAIRTDGRVVLLRSADGSVERVFDEQVATDGDTPPTVAATATVDHAYVEDGSSDRVRVISLASGDARTETEGSRPSLSPDDERLAFVGGGRDEPQHVLVRDLTTGDENDLGPVTDIDGALSARQVSFSPSGRELVLAVITSDGTSGVWSLDPDRQALRDARRLGPSTQGESWEMAAPYGQNLLVLQRCCAPDGSTVGVEEVEPASGTVLASPATDFPTPIAWIDVDATGRFFLLVTENNILWRWDGSTAPTHLLADVVSAAW